MARLIRRITAMIKPMACENVVILPIPTIRAVAVAGGWLHSSQIIARLDRPMAMDKTTMELTVIVPVSDAPCEKNMEPKSSAANPEASPSECERSTVRGAAAADIGIRKRIKAEGPSGGNSKGKWVSKAIADMTAIAMDPSIKTKSLTTLSGCFSRGSR